MRLIPRFACAFAFAVLAIVPIARADDPGTIVVLYEVPTAIQFTVAPGVPCKLNYPDTKVKLWKSNQAPFDGSDIPANAPFTSGQGVFGDANGDGVVKLDDLIAIRNARGTQDSAKDFFTDGYINDDDITTARNALGNGANNTLTVYVQALQVSTALGDVAIELLTDPDHDSNYTVANTVHCTVVDIEIDSGGGMIGSVVTVSISPAIAPLTFDANTTMTWSGELYPDYDIAYPPVAPSEHIVTSYSAAQLHETAVGTAQFVVGDGTKTSGQIGDMYLYGYIYGPITVNFGSVSVSGTFAYYVDTPYGFSAASAGAVGDPVFGLNLVEANNPAMGSLQLEECYASMYVATILADKNTLSTAIAPEMLPVDIITYDYFGNQIDRVSLWMWSSGRSDFGPDIFSYYSNWDTPIVFVNAYVAPAAHPTLTLIKADPYGWVDMRIR